MFGGEKARDRRGGGQLAADLLFFRLLPLLVAPGHDRHGWHVREGEGTGGSGTHSKGDPGPPSLLLPMGESEGGGGSPPPPPRPSGTKKNIVK